MDLYLIRLWLVVMVMLANAQAVMRPSAITIYNNGYSGILIAVDPSVAEDLYLLDDIKTMLTDASAYLHHATEKRTYFKDVTILVPNSWAMNSAWKPAASELYNNADVVIQNPVPQTRANTRYRASAMDKQPTTRAYTRTFGGCGQPGVRINIFTDVFGRRKPYGPSGRVFVHEWARFRWGVFNEYAHDGEPQFYYSPTTGKVEPIRCNINMKGRIYRIDPATGRGTLCEKINPSTGTYDEGCEFNPYVYGHFNDNVTASIMDRPAVPSILHFCNDDRTKPNNVHNYEAPSQHNRICGGRSTWSVIMDSQDFKGNANPPKDISDTTPTFNIVRQANNRRMVMAIDTSNSMEEDGKLTRARQAAASLISDALDDEAQVGVVTFSSQAVVASPVQRVGDKDKRKKIAHSLPSKAQGITSIGAALLKSVEVLEHQGHGVNGTFIVIFTDGKDTATPAVVDVVNRIQNLGVIVNVIALSGQVEPSLYQLAVKTGGRFYFDSTDPRSTSTMNAILDVYSVFDSGHKNQPVQVLSKSKTLAPKASINGFFYVDESLGRHTQIIGTFTQHVPDLTVTSPTGRPYGSLYQEYSLDKKLKRIKIDIKGVSESGLWSFQLTNTQAYLRETLSILVLSYGRDPHVEPLRLTGAVLTSNEPNNSIATHSRIVAEVKRGGEPVVHAKVMATVFMPVGSPMKFRLFDSGTGADIMGEDGLYSRYFIKFNDDGQYSVKIEVVDVDQKMDSKGIDEDEIASMACINAGSVLFKSKSKRKGGGRMSDSVPPVDVHPPVRITDLRVLHTNSTEGTIVLAWTSPGDDLDHDKASSYTVLFAANAKDVLHGKKKRKLNQNWVIEGTLKDPKPFGNREQITVRIPMTYKNNISVAFAIYALDEAGNKGELSNVATAGFGSVPDFSDQEYLSMYKAKTEDPIDVPHPTGFMITVVVGLFSSLLGTVVIGTIVIQVIIFLRKRFKREFPTDGRRNFIV